MERVEVHSGQEEGWWKEMSDYQKKLVTAEQAVQVVRSGDWVDYGWCVGTPVACDKALAARYQELKEVKLRGGILLALPEVLKVPDVSAHFIWNSWHMSSIERHLVESGAVYYIPVRYSELPRYYREDLEPIRAAFLQVAPVDQDGYFSFGVNGSHMDALIQRCEYIFVEVNRNMPPCPGRSSRGIHLSQVSGVIEGDDPPLWQLHPAQPTQLDGKIAEKVVERIPNGACIQLGIGGLPNAIGALIARSELKDLGVHTEMYVDAFVDIAHAGKITGSKKAIDKGKQVFTFAAGTQKLYDYLKEEPACLSAQSDHTNDIRVIAQLDDFISINSAVDLDLFGQVNAESVGVRHISGAGGQLDFAIGACLSRGGKSFLCFSSTVKDKQGNVTSRIRPTLREGSVVTTPRNCVQYLVTEYGLVNVRGASTWERAEKIISIAHPDFREGLISDAEKMQIWRRSNKR